MDEEVRQLQATLDQKRFQLETVGQNDGARAWLRSSLKTQDGTEKLLAQLSEHIAQDSFLLQLQRDAQNAPPPIPGGEHHEVLSKDWWSVTDANNPEEAAREVDSFVIVEHEDYLEALGSFIAAHLATCPEARNMQPHQLQDALSVTFKELRQSRLQKVWQWGRTFYRCAAVSYSAFSLYSNPWLVRAVVASVWTASRVLAGLV